MLTYQSPGREGRAAVVDFPDFADGAPYAVHEAPPTGWPEPRLLDRVREAIRARHYSRRTEKAYVAWIRRDIFFHDKRHPAERGRPRSRAS